MGFTHLTFDPILDKEIGNKYLYLFICRPDYYSKQIDSLNQDLKEQKTKKVEFNKKKQELLDQLELNNLTHSTLMNKGIINLHNSDIPLENILEKVSSINHYLQTDIIYKIDLVSGKKEYYKQNKFYTNQFKVVTKISNLKELLTQLSKDNLLTEFISKVFYNYGNAGNVEYKEFLLNAFDLTKQINPNYLPTISDIIRNNQYRDGFNDRIQDLTKYGVENLLELINSDSIILKEKYKYPTLVIPYLIKNMLFGLLDVYFKTIEENEYPYLYKLSDTLLKNYDNKIVKNICDKLNIKPKGMNLIIFREYEKHLEVPFENINALKTFLIKNYNFNYDELINTENIESLRYYPDDEECEYKFKIEIF